ncbi:unnamed protein product [Heterotrigona itama]|uniref:Uncharacterized protein n=1 Tax=Heterotrigona itama TaxID=395501 RepID=A0A6V7H6X6_9HYME|nr:unnamed protein product [Heterotrigona itama]
MHHALQFRAVTAGSFAALSLKTQISLELQDQRFPEG